MTAADLIGADEERAEAALLAAAGKILSDEDRAVPAEFIAGLFAHAIPEDLMRYAAREVAELAGEAWALISERKPGTACANRPAMNSAGTARSSSLRILPAAASSAASARSSSAPIRSAAVMAFPSARRA